MTAVALDVDAVRGRFSALRTPTALFDAPGGTQVPDSVIDAIAGYLRESNANLGGAFGSSRRTDALLAQARLTAAAFLRCEPDETIFGANMTTLNFALTRAVGRTLRKGDEILVTKLDHDGNVAPWLELAHDLGLEVGFVEVADDTTLDYDDLERKLTDRTRIVAFTLASNAVGTLTDARRIAELAHAAGALTWVDAVHYAPHAPIDVGELQADVLLCSPYKFFGPHLGLASVRADLASLWRTYKVRPATPSSLRDRHARATSCSPASSPPWNTSTRSAGRRSRRASARSGSSSSTASPSAARSTACGRWRAACRPSPSPSTARSPRDVAEHLGDHDIAVWDGDYYAVEVMQRLGLDAGRRRPRGHRPLQHRGRGRPPARRTGGIA